MEGPTHGALVAGVSSGVVAAWTRKKAWERYDPDVEPPSYRERMKTRAPIIAKGIGFTGLTWAVAKEFDKIEATVLADSYTGYPAPINYQTHHNLHSLPYIGGIYGAAHLIKHSAAEFGNWIGEQFNVPNKIGEITDSLEEFAEWIINSSIFGAVGHIVGDIPTKAVSLKLLKPILDTNFALKLVTHDAQPWNRILFNAGTALTGASWMLTTAYLLSWKPPELRVQDYVAELKEYESFRAVIKHILMDIEERLTKALELGKQTVFDLSAFSISTEAIRENPFQNWFDLDIPPTVFGLESFDKDSFREIGILPPDFSSRIETSSLYNKEQLWPNVNGIPLVVSEKAITQETRPLFKAEETFQPTSLIGDETRSTRPIFGERTSETDEEDFTSQM